MQFLLTLILFPALVYAQAVDDEFACTPADPSWSISEVSDWASQMDILGDKALRKKKPGDMATSFGNPIDVSCYHGLEPKEWKRRLQRMEAGIAYAMTQAQRCWSTLGVGAATGIIPKLRRIRISCSNKKGVAAAASQFGINAPTYSHTYELIRWGEYMDTTFMETVGSTLFHEALHWSVSNNRHWHNDASEKNYTGCKNSVFEDRIYMLEAACFPLSNEGMQFYQDPKAASKCPGLCEKALTETDPNTLHWAQRAFQGGTQSLWGHKYKPMEAKLLCDRIRNVPKNYEKSRKTLRDLQKRNAKVMKWAVNHFGNDEQGKALRQLARETLDVSAQAYEPASFLPEVLKSFEDKRKAFLNEVQGTCSLGPKSDELLSFCKFYTANKNPVSEELTRLSKQLKSVKVSDFSLYTSAPSSGHDVTLYPPNK